MKYGPHIVQGNSHPRTGPIGDLGTRRLEHGLDVPPGDIRPDGIFENGLERASVLRSHTLTIVSIHDTSVKFQLSVLPAKKIEPIVCTGRSWGRKPTHTRQLSAELTLNGESEETHLDGIFTPADRLEGMPNELTIYATEGVWTGSDTQLRRHTL